MFKWPKISPDNVHTTYEHISEHMAYRLGMLLDIPTAQVDIGYFNNRIGSLSYLINKTNEELCEGALFILGKHPGDDVNKLFDPNTERYYSTEHIFESAEDQQIKEHLIVMMFFDYLIDKVSLFIVLHRIILKQGIRKDSRYPVFVMICSMFVAHNNTHSFLILMSP